METVLLTMILLQLAMIFGALVALPNRLQSDRSCACNCRSGNQR